MNAIAEKRIAHSSKDVSNGGIFGTVLQLIRYSGVGANINVNKIVVPPVLSKAHYTLEMYSRMYLTTSFVLTASEDNSEEIIEVFKKHKMNASVIGKIIKNKHLFR